MGQINVQIGGRSYALACRDGEEAHLRAVGALVDKKARDAGSALGSMTEARQLLFASLLLADELKEQRAGNAPASAEIDASVADALERLAERIEGIAARLESQAANA